MKPIIAGHRISLCLLSLVASTAAAQGNLLVNGGFEAGNFTENSMFRDRMRLSSPSTAILGWTTGNGGGWATTWWLRKPSFGAAEGSRALSLDGNDGAGSWAEQAIATKPGTRYLVTLQVASDENAGPAVTRVKVNGSAIGSVTHGTATPTGATEFPNLNWQRVAFIFTASTSNSVLRLEDASAGFYNTIVDDVSVTPLVTANLAVNGGFEDGEFTVNSQYADRMQLPSPSTAVPGWTTGNGGGWATTWWLRKPSFGAAEGSRALSLDGNDGAGSWTEQTVPTILGAAYQVAFHVASDDNAGPAVTEVLVNGTRIGSVTHGSGTPTGATEFPSLNWQPVSFTFTATGMQTVLRIADATRGFYNTIVDNVSVTALPSAPLARIEVAGLRTVRVSWPGELGVTYRVERSHRLAPGEWVDLGFERVGAGAMLNATFAVGTDAETYFRIVAQR